MILPDMPFTVTDWDNIPVTEHIGITGVAYWRTVTMGDIRLRLVEYSANYLADHWCDRGHILYVIGGELVSELRDGQVTILSSGMSYQVSDFGDAAHRSSTTIGAKLFIVD